MLFFICTAITCGIIYNFPSDVTAVNRWTVFLELFLTPLDVKGLIT